VPTRSLRLVVFSLEQQKEIFRSDVFTRASPISHPIFERAGLGSVDYAYSRTVAATSIVGDLMNQELESERRPMKCFLRSAGAYFPTAPADRRGNAPGRVRVFYLQLQPFFAIRWEFSGQHQLRRGQG